MFKCNYTYNDFTEYELQTGACNNENTCICEGICPMQRINQLDYIIYMIADLKIDDLKKLCYDSMFLDKLQNSIIKDIENQFLSGDTTYREFLGYKVAQKNNYAIRILKDLINFNLKYNIK